MSEKPPTSPALDLDPGARRRSRSSGWKCCCWTLAFLVGGFVLFFVGAVAYALFDTVTKGLWPHAEHVHNKTQESLPVIPLVDREQRFDIGVSVWVRPTEEEIRKIWEARDAEAVGEVEEVVVKEEGNVEAGTAKMEALVEKWEREDVDLAAATPLFSDVVFKGVTLRDKNILRKVQFTLPTARFCGVNLTNMDLRASFVLIPTSPSPFDYVMKWSNYVPAAVHRLPQRTWPFPLGSTDTREKTMADNIIEARGINIPLLELRGLLDTSDQLLATKTVTVTVTAPSPSKLPALETDEDDEEDVTGEDDVAVVEKSEDDKAKEAKVAAAAIKQPFVITRTQLRVIDDQSRYALKAFNKRHNDLKATSCGQSLPGGKLLNRRWCTNSYNDIGPFGTRLRLTIPQDDGTALVQRAYAPYMLTNPISNSVMDLERIPVNRTNFTPEATAWNSTVLLDTSHCLQQPEMNITWHIAFSGRTPAKSWFADRAMDFLPMTNVSLNSTELSKALQRDRLELAHALGGHQYSPESHPRRRFITQMMGWLIAFSLFFLDIHYWYSRVSTVGIAVTAHAVLAITALLTGLFDFGTLLATEVVPETTGIAKTVGAVGFLLFTFILAHLPVLAMLKGVGQLSLRWRGWIPIIDRSPPTHWERASQRLDRQTSRRDIALIFCTLFFGTVVVAPLFTASFTTPLRLIPSLLPPPIPSELPKRAITTYVIESLKNSVSLTTLAVQFLLNRRAKTFAGRHKIATFLDLVGQVAHLATLVRIFGGRWDARPGWSVFEAVELGLVGAVAVQAWTLPRVPTDANLEEEE